MKKPFRRWLAALMAASMTLALTACSGGDNSSTAGVSGDKMFNVVMTSNYSGFDPLRTNDSVSSSVNNQIYETLYRLEDDGSFTPLLAESLPEYSEDGKTVTVKLRSGVAFHDGTPFNADAVINTFNCIKDPDFGSTRASLASSIESMEAPDENTVVFHLSYPDGVFLAKLSHVNSAIVSPTAQQNQDLMVQPCGTGPYKFVSAVSGSNVVLTRNDEYWGQKAQIKDVTYTVITEESTALSRLETGEADLMPSITVENLSRVEAMPNVTLATGDTAQIYYMVLRPNSSVNPLMANQDFRTAIAKALDTEGYVNYIMEGHAEHAKSIIGPKIFGYTKEAESSYIGYDLEGAKKLIEENGWADEPITFLIPSNPTYTPMGEYFESNLKAAGFNNVKLETMDWAAWLAESKAENRFDITLSAWSNVTRDGTELLEPNWESTASSRTKINDAEFDALVLESKTTVNDDERIAALEAANKLLMEKAYAVPILNSEQRYAYNSAYGNVTLNSQGIFYLNEFTCN